MASHFTIPDFLELCQRLTKKHVISINSNIDSPKVMQFVETINPDGSISSIAPSTCSNAPSASACRSSSSTSRPCAQRVRRLCHLGHVPGGVSALPVALGRARRRGLMPWPKAFRGNYDGKRYPDAYTDEERALIVEYSKRAEAFYKDQFSLRDDRPTIDPVIDREVFLKGIPNFRGRQCAAGHDLVRIDARATSIAAARRLRSAASSLASSGGWTPSPPAPTTSARTTAPSTSIAPRKRNSSQPERPAAPVIPLIPV